MLGTTDALLQLTADVQASLSCGHQVLCVSFDLQKAYDTTWKRGILKTLHEFGLLGAMGHYIQGFLANRRFQTKVGSHLSTRSHPQEDGVPQGSVLSCSLFSVAINGILACLPHNVKGILYVDDLLIYSSGSYYPAIERRIQVAINSIHDWALKRGFTFSPARSVAIHFHRKCTMQPPATLFIAGRPIPARECIKYLGMLLDRRLT